MMIRVQRLIVLLLGIGDVGAYIELTGAGATVPASVYVSWMAGFKSSRAPFVDVRLGYKALGSGYGKRAVASRSVNYAGSDSLLSDDDYDSHPHLQMFPSIALSVSLHYIFFSCSGANWDWYLPDGSVGLPPGGPPRQMLRGVSE